MNDNYRLNKVLTDKSVRDSYLNNNWLTPIALIAVSYNITSTLLSFEVFNEPKVVTTTWWGWTSCNSGTSYCAKVDIKAIQMLAYLVAYTIHHVKSKQQPS